MKFFKGLAGQTVIYGLGTIVPRLLNYLLFTPFYTRIFEVGEYGSFNILYACSSLLFVILTFGMETTYFRFSINKEDEQSTYNHTFFFTSLFASLFLIAILIFNNGVSNFMEFDPLYIKCFAFIIFFDVFTSIPFARLRNQNKALKFSIIKLINVSVNIFLNIFFFVICRDSDNQTLASFYNPNIGIGYAFISNVVSSATSFLLLLPNMINFQFRFSLSKYRDFLSYSWPVIIIGIGGMINEVSDKFFIENLTPESLDPLRQVGLYSANYKIAVLMSIFIQMFRYAAEPFFFKKSVNSDAKQTYREVMNYFSIFCLLIFIGVCVYIDLFKYFISENYWSGLDVVPIVLLANMFLGIYYNQSVWYKINNKTKYGAVITLIGAVITIVFNVKLIPLIGFKGSAIATIACYAVMMIVSYFWGQKVYPIDYDVKRFFLYMTVAILIVFLRNQFAINNLFVSLSIGTALIIFYLAFLYYFERKNIKKLLCK